MPYFTSSEEWQRQSALLLQARPNTVHASADSKPAQPIAQLELKTFDPVSGTTLKYRTDKAAEVGRLIAAMGSLGREMAALPEVKGDVIMEDATQDVEANAEAPVQAQPQQQNTAPKKKKKGKK
ncbi:hypothetical protein M436DRAFT_69325 [Aureobasidium namibiae CBS 147.97]|uniref:SRP9 domain-containing protein n=1 Tax=Aureobasidium namibiae CBS 147.97 TaxID=1043004 RepID=A0A074WYF7_9PEZI|nr:uncharacterized protein M436DRAFT_69325 [Aureobasidium namibiae CBS 147.97]KEQ78208.1 hypothetical protein M436DRAFT_69325 [Aureobasidium namibiae CBS 147.97]